MFTIQAKTVHMTMVTSLVALALALLSPAALAAGQHSRYGGHGGAYGHGSHAYRGSAYRSRSRAHRSRAYRYRGHRGYRGAYRPARYRRHRSHNHWSPGDVLGAVVAGAIITNVIADAVQPRTTVVERRVYRSSYPDYSRDTRYIGRDNGYYDRRR